MNIFQRILSTNSLTVATYLAEEALEKGSSGEDEVALKAIHNSNKLDEIRAISYDRLGQHEEASKLRDFMKKKAIRSPSLRQISSD